MSGDRDVLWYAEPAGDWEHEGLPIGNGFMGVVIFGGLGVERLQFNEKTLWTGGPGSVDAVVGAHGPDKDLTGGVALAPNGVTCEGAPSTYLHGDWVEPRPGTLAEVRRHIDEHGSMEPEEAARRLGNPSYATIGHTPGFGAFQPFGDVHLEFPGHEAAADYRRELDIGDASARVTYRVDDIGFTREYFASYPARAVVGRISADRPAGVSFTIRLTSPHSDASVVDGRLLLRGALADNGMVYEAQLHVAASGGNVSSRGDEITAAGADSVTFILSAATDYADAYPSYRGPDPRGLVTDLVDNASQLDYDVLKAAHVGDHRGLYDRVRFDVGQRMPADVPTDQLVAAYPSSNPAADRALEALFFAYGRYLLIASSRPGSLPANLQGVWNQSATPPWESDYHTNINVQMNYWLAETTGLSECAEPLHRLVDTLREPGRRTASVVFGSVGWTVNSCTNPFGFTGLHDWATSFWMPEANGWLAQHLYERYLFDLDESFLRDTAYPVLRETAEFWLANLCTDPHDGSLVVSPSYSPEQGPFTAGASISQQIVHDLLTNTAEAARILGDDAFAATVSAAVDRLDPGLRIGSWGQLQEWRSDLDDPENDHRHVSQLFALHPGRRISPRTTPDLADAARVTLTARGDGGTGWSRAWKVSFWARLLDGDHAHLILAEQLRHSTLANLWDTHPPFQIDGNFGATAGIAEMLLQSHTDAIDVLPALPAAWAESGSFDGLRARGGFTIGVTWRGGKPTEIRVRSHRGGTARLRGSARWDLDGVRVIDDAGRLLSCTVADDGILLVSR